MAVNPAPNTPFSANYKAGAMPPHGTGHGHSICEARARNPFVFQGTLFLGALPQAASFQGDPSCQLSDGSFVEEVGKQEEHELELEAAKSDGVDMAAKLATWVALVGCAADGAAQQCACIHRLDSAG
jgi:hypothetical protein